MIQKDIWVPRWSVIPAQDKAVFQSMATTLAPPMQVITDDKFSGVSRLALTSTYYVKTFSGRGERFKHLLGVSRYHRELENLEYFARLGLPTPQVAAHGQQSTLGFLRQGLLVTLEVENSISLEELIDSGQLYAKGIAYVKSLLEQLASGLQRLHRDGFFHRDLKTRNVLVQNTGDACKLYFFDCPSGYHPPRYLRRRSVMRDLAYLERGLRGQVRATDLLYAYKCYRGVDKLGPDDRKLALATLKYYGNRRMTRKRRLRAASRGKSSHI